jgi:RNA polymerase sigma-70 factor (ECF subfamily)
MEGEVEMESHDFVMERRGQESAVAEVPRIRRRLTVDRDADLAERLCRHEPGTTEALVAVYGDRVYRLAIGITGNHSDAEEIVQDALCTVVRRIETFRGDAAFGSWVYRISANAAYQKRRARRVERNEMSWEDLGPSFEETGAHVHPGSDWSPRLKDPVLQAELQSVLCAAIDQLPADHRAIFLLHDVEGLSNREIAAALRVKVATIKSRVHRARLFLRCRLAVYVGSAEAMPGAVGGSTSGAIHRPLPPLAARATPGRRPSPSTVSAP